MSYAKGTTVSPEKTRAEIETSLKRFGADGFAYFTDSARTMIGFSIAGRSVRIELPMPSVNDKNVARDGHGVARTGQRLVDALDGETRRRWRCLALIIKAKLASIEDGISTVDREFLADVVLADGRTLIQVLRPQLEEARGKPLLLKQANQPRTEELHGT